MEDLSHVETDDPAALVTLGLCLVSREDWAGFQLKKRKKRSAQQCSFLLGFEER